MRMTALLGANALMLVAGLGMLPLLGIGAWMYFADGRMRRARFAR